MVGVGRKWIHGFSLITKLLMLLTKIAVQQQFPFSKEAEATQNELKCLISTAPVLIKLDYGAVKLLSHVDPLPWPLDHGLVIATLDSCQNGTGWILYQMVEKDKHLAKLELYGVFCVVKDLWHWIWGIHFQIDINVKFLIKMVKQLDPPNAPMTWWISYIALFNYVMNHIPAQSHAGIDGLSQQRCTSEDTEDKDAEEYLDKFMGSASLVSPPLPPISLTNFLSSESLYAFQPTCLDKNFFQDLLLTMWHTPQTPYTSFHTMSIADDLSILSVGDPNPSLAIKLHKIKQEHFNPSEKECSSKSLIKQSLLSIMDDFSYTGCEFEYWKVCTPIMTMCSLGNEVFTMELYCYWHSYMSSLKQGASQPLTTDQLTLPGIPDPLLRMDNRVNYEDVPAMHTFGVKDKDSLEMWKEIITYLKTDIMPISCEDPVECKTFIRWTKNYFLHNGVHLWKIESKGRLPHLVVMDIDRHSALIAEAHNDVGHWGWDTTYKTLLEHFFWPNMFDQIVYFMCSCNICQLCSKTQLIVTFSPTWNYGILRHFDLDTVHMPDGISGMKFLLQATDPSIYLVEAQAATCASSEAWANFLYEEVYCWFRGVLLCLVDGALEFKGVVEILFKQYGIATIVSSPYHPEGNGHVECSHQTLVNSILQACGENMSWWPLYLHTGLWAMWCSTLRVTGYPPYFLLYGCHPFFAFDFADRNWDTLDWHNVTSTKDLLVLRMQQILQWDKKLVLAMDQQKKVCQQVDDFNHKHAHYLSSGSFVVGTWVLLHKTWLDSQMGNKGVLLWTGPYIVHRQLRDMMYQLWELDGTVMRGSVAANRLKVFYYWEEHQTVCTVQPTKFSLHVAAVFSSSAHASTVIGTLNQDLLVTPPYLVSVKNSIMSFPDNRSLVYFPTVTPFTLLHKIFTIATTPLSKSSTPRTTMQFNLSISTLPRVLSMVTFTKTCLKVQAFVTSKLGLLLLSLFTKSFFLLFIWSLPQNDGGIILIFSLFVEVQNDLFMALRVFC